MNATSKTEKYQATWESLQHYRVPQWYQDAKFGIFIHWGVYSVPAFGNEWYPRQMYLQGTEEFQHHVATFGPHARWSSARRARSIHCLTTSGKPARRST